MSGMTIHQVYAALKTALPNEASDAELPKVEVDSRLITIGDVFVALPGAHSDGHEHLDSAIANGAQLLVVQRDMGKEFSVPQIVVADGLRALADLATFHREHCRGKVIGITGSVGKTTAKDFLLQLFAKSQFAAYAAPKSYNSEIGLPLAMLGAPRDVDFIVLEYGINEPGEMQYLIDVVKPDMATIVAIGAAHLEGLGDLQTIAHEKNRLLQSVSPSGSVWIDNLCLELLNGEERGWLAEPHFYDHDTYSYSFDGTKFAIRDHPQLGEAEVACIAPHELRLAMLMADIALGCKVSPVHIKESLSTLVKPYGRLQQLRVGDIDFIDDAYNANPTSMLSALQALSELPCAGRRIAVLGSMLDLGSQQQELHAKVGRSLDEFAIDTVLCVGDLASVIADAAPQHVRVVRVADCAAASIFLSSYCGADDLVLLKASRADKLERVLVSFEEILSTTVK
jgi:UDP-N-acetylmuramoyl-tripeptide--D-alanyl-D-alanine ligase